MKCDYCEKEIRDDVTYIKFEGERICENCYTTNTTTSYYVDGEFLGTDDDVEEHDWFVDDVLGRREKIE